MLYSVPRVTSWPTASTNQSSAQNLISDHYISCNKALDLTEKIKVKVIEGLSTQL